MFILYPDILHLCTDIEVIYNFKQTIFKSVLTMKGLSKFDLREFNKIIGFGEFYSIRLLFNLLLSNRADNICQQVWTIVLEIVWDFF